MLVKSALLNLEVQQFFASRLPFVLLSVCLCRALIPSLTRSVITSVNVFPLRAHVPVDFKSFRCLQVTCHDFLVFCLAIMEFETLFLVLLGSFIPHILLVFYQFNKHQIFSNIPFF